MLGYLGQSYLYFGSTIQEVIESYKLDSSATQLEATLSDIERFVHAHQYDLDAAFDAAYSSGVGPELCGHTTASFFLELKRLIELPLQ